MYPKALECIQSEHDRQVLKAILAQITSVNFTAKLQGVQNRSSVSSAKASIHHKLTKLEEIQRTSLIVRNDMTVEAQRRLYKRIIQQRNIKEIRLHNKHVAVIDKYTTALCQHTGIPKPRQPLPDYMHWYVDAIISLYRD